MNSRIGSTRTRALSTFCARRTAFSRRFREVAGTAADGVWQSCRAPTPNLGLASGRDQVGLRVDGEKLAFFELACPAFPAGPAHFAELALRGAADPEAARWNAEKARYAGEIARRLERSS